MIKNNRGVTLSALVITIIVILILAGVTITTSDFLIKDTKSKTIISNMYLIKGKVESIYEDYEFSKTTTLPGTNESASSLSAYGVTYSAVTEENDTWYRWNSATIKSLGFDENMLTGNAEYIVNYATGEVIYTKGIDDGSGTIKYKLSDIKNKEQ